MGGDQRPDDEGLPAVDIEVPDDASELDRDVQAYYRELRAQRRRARLRRLSSPVARDGMVLPVLAGCLALTLLAGAMLTVLTAGPDNGGLRTPATSGSSSAPHVLPSAGTAGRPLPSAIVAVNGEDQPLGNLAGPVLVLALVPTGCECLADLRMLAGQAGQAGAHTYVVGLGAAGAQAGNLTRQLGLSPDRAVVDVQNTLAHVYHPGALTAVVVGPDGLVAHVVHDNHGFRLAPELRSLVASGSPHLPDGHASTTA